MSVIEQLHTSAVQVEGFREGLDRVRGVLDQTDALLSVADEVLIKADEALSLAADVLADSRRWAPRVVIVVGVLAVAGIVTAVIVRGRRRRAED